MTDEMVRVLMLAVKHGLISEERYEELLDDYVLVPKEPTEAMVKAGEGAYFLIDNSYGHEVSAMKLAYKAIIRSTQENE